MKNHEVIDFNQSNILGQSGSRVELLFDNYSQPFVRKFSMPENLGRFLKQYEKHLRTLNFSTPIGSPQILGTVSEETFSYDMEFIRGKTLGEYLKVADSKSTKSICDIFINYFAYLFNGSTINSDLNIEMKFKVEKALENIDNKDIVFRNLGSYLFEKINKLKIYSGNNHGDFSFENLIISNEGREIVAVDFLDSPFDSPQIDLGRIWLDLRYGWWKSGVKESANMHLNRTIISREIVKEVEKYGIDKDQLSIFCGLAILRIRPYTKDVVRMAYLKFASNQILGGNL
jgi:hypothetical protein